MRSIPHMCIFWVLLSSAAQAQSKKNPSTCPHVSAKNAQEALTMEGASNKKGCWARDSAGKLVFLTDPAPPKDYKPLLNAPSRPARATLPPSPPQLAGEIAGRWSLTATNSLLPKYWEKGTLTVSPLLGVQWKCDQHSTGDFNTLTWIGPPVKCDDDGPQNSMGNSCAWKLSKSSTGAYHVQCSSGEKFLNGTIVVQGSSISGKIVDSADEHLPWTMSFTGSKLIP